MSKDFKLILATIFMAAWFGFLLGNITSAQEAHVYPQVAFKVDHEAAPGKYVIEALEVRPAYTVEPIDGEHPAPMLVGSITVCRPYNEGPKLFLRCGMDRYAVRNIGLVSKKGEKE